MGMFSKLFGRGADPSPAAPLAPPLGLDAGDPRAAAERCLSAVAEIAQTGEDPRQRALLLAQIAQARLHSGELDATLQALVAAFNVGLQQGLLSWMVELCREFAAELPKGAARARLRPMVDALVRVVEVIDDAELADELRGEIGPLQALVGDYAGAAATVQQIGDDWSADQARARVVERMCENGELRAVDTLTAELQDPEAQATARKAIVHARAAHKVDAALESYAAAIKLQPWRDDVRLDLAVAKAHQGDLEGGLVLARAIGRPETQATAIGQIGELLIERGEGPRAEQLVLELPERSGRGGACAALAGAYLRKGDAAAAERLLDELGDPWTTVEVALRIARSPLVREDAEHVAKLLMRSLVALRGAQSANEYQAARRKTAEILANGGNATEAMQVVEVAPPDERGELLTAVGFGLALHGALADIDRLQGGFKRSEQRAALLLGAADALLRRAATGDKAI